ncbi:MAG: hypothetical protein ACLFP8_00085 [Alphaproteobacteria bacterium]
MNNKYQKRISNMYWTYHWTYGDQPLVRFTNPKACTNVIYTIEELKFILDSSDKENSFIPVPRSVMQGAYDTVIAQLGLGTMVA